MSAKMIRVVTTICGFFAINCYKFLVILEYNFDDNFDQIISK